MNPERVDLDDGSSEYTYMSMCVKIEEDAKRTHEMIEDEEGDLSFTVHPAGYLISYPMLVFVYVVSCEGLINAPF